MEVEGLNQSLYFQAAQMAGQSAVKAQKNQHTEKTTKTKKLFSNSLEKSKTQLELVNEGLPVEIADMEIEDAAIYLMDQADIAADKLKESQIPENFSDYRKKVSQFLKFVAFNNFKVTVKKRNGFNRKRQPLPPRFQISIINQKLDEMANYLLVKHKDTFHMLAKIDEIKGLMIDLIAT